MSNKQFNYQIYIRFFSFLQDGEREKLLSFIVLLFPHDPTRSAYASIQVFVLL